MGPPDGATPACEVRGLTHRYGALTALDSVQLALQPGVVTGLAGRNGSGKSTLMRVLAGVQRPTRGRIEVAGEDLYGDERAGRGTGAWIDGYDLWPSWTAARTLSYLADLAGARGADIDRAVSLTACGSLLRRRVGSLSLGNRQRVALAAAVVAGRTLLLLDEPMNGLDLDGRSLVRALIQQMAADGRAVFVSSHDLNELQSLCTALVILDAGAVSFDGPARDFARGHSMAVFEMGPGDLAVAARVLTAAGIPHRLDEFGAVVSTGQRDSATAALRGADLRPAHVSIRPATLEETLDEHR